MGRKKYLWAEEFWWLYGPKVWQKWQKRGRKTFSNFCLLFQGKSWDRKSIFCEFWSYYKIFPSQTSLKILTWLCRIFVVYRWIIFPILDGKHRWDLATLEGGPSSVCCFHQSPWWGTVCWPGGAKLQSGGRKTVKYWIYNTHYTTVGLGGRTNTLALRIKVGKNKLSRN